MLTETKILEILNDWNFWHHKPATGKPREKYLKEIQKHLKLGMIISLVGLRRSGKSTLLLQTAQHLIESKQKTAAEILYVNFEDARFLGEYSLELLDVIFQTYQANLKPLKKPVIILDEIQNIVGWEKFVNSLYERKIAQILVSGSNANLLQSEYSTVLTGRQTVITVHPLDFGEYLAFKNIKVKSTLEIIQQQASLKKHFQQYLEFGGLPKVVLTQGANEKRIILRNYFEDIFQRDLIGRFKIRGVAHLELLAKFYFTNIATRISFNNIQKFTKIPLTTVERFSDYFTRPYLFHFLKIFSYSLKEQAVNARKVYACDLGLRNAISQSFSQDTGRLLENLIFLNLLWHQKDFTYYRTKNNLEVDFVVFEKNKKKQLIQVCMTLDDFKTRERELRALRVAMAELKLKSGLIITQDQEEALLEKGVEIKIIPAWKWLLK